MAFSGIIFLIVAAEHESRKLNTMSVLLEPEQPLCHLAATYMSFKPCRSRTIATWWANAAMPLVQRLQVILPWHIKACAQQVIEGGSFLFCFTPHIAYPFNINSFNYVPWLINSCSKTNVFWACGAQELFGAWVWPSLHLTRKNKEDSNFVGPTPWDWTFLFSARFSWVHLSHQRPLGALGPNMVPCMAKGISHIR